MTLYQRGILIFGGLVLLAMVAFPPWVYVFSPPDRGVRSEVNKSERFAGYYFLLNDHTPQDHAALIQKFNLTRISFQDDADIRFFSIRIDSTRLAIQIIVTVIVIWLFWFAAKSRTQN